MYTQALEKKNREKVAINLIAETWGNGKKKKKMFIEKISMSHISHTHTAVCDIRLAIAFDEFNGANWQAI